MSEHTAGPWEVELHLPYATLPRVYAGSRGALICVVGNAVIEQDVWEANARLIAAAPEMLAALQKAERVLLGWEHVEDSSEENAALTKVRSAIAAAKFDTHRSGK